MSLWQYLVFFLTYNVSIQPSMHICMLAILLADAGGFFQLCEHVLDDLIFGLLNVILCPAIGCVNQY